jgi:hypothetical protein
MPCDCSPDARMRNEYSGQVPMSVPAALVERPLTPIVLCCPGRGGSSIVWNLIGSSSSVLMTVGEWHELALPGGKPARSILRRAYSTGVASPESPAGRVANRALAHSAARRLRAGIENEDVVSKPGAGDLAVKLMDYQLFWLPAIQRGFGTIKPVILTRHPLAHAESLMRSKLSVERAAQWCSDVLHLMIWVRDRWSAPVVRFEDLLQDPEKFARRLYKELHLEAEHLGMYRLKRKDYGEQRNQWSAQLGKRVHLPAADLRNFVDPAVNEKAIARLTAEQRRVIMKIARPAAEQFGYEF